MGVPGEAGPKFQDRNIMEEFNPIFREVPERVWEIMGNRGIMGLMSRVDLNRVFLFAHAMHAGCRVDELSSEFSMAPSSVNTWRSDIYCDLFLNPPTSPIKGKVTGYHVRFHLAKGLEYEEIAEIYSVPIKKVIKEENEPPRRLGPKSVTHLIQMGYSVEEIGAMYRVDIETLRSMLDAEPQVNIAERILMPVPRIIEAMRSRIACEERDEVIVKKIEPKVLSPSVGALRKAFDRTRGNSGAMVPNSPDAGVTETRFTHEDLKEIMDEIERLTRRKDKLNTQFRELNRLIAGDAAELQEIINMRRRLQKEEQGVNSNLYEAYARRALIKESLNLVPSGPLHPEEN